MAFAFRNLGVSNVFFEDAIWGKIEFSNAEIEMQLGKPLENRVHWRLRLRTRSAGTAQLATAVPVLLRLSSSFLPTRKSPLDYKKSTFMYVSCITKYRDER